MEPSWHTSRRPGGGTHRISSPLGPCWCPGPSAEPTGRPVPWIERIAGRARRRRSGFRLDEREPSSRLTIRRRSRSWGRRCTRRTRSSRRLEPDGGAGLRELRAGDAAPGQRGRGGLRPDRARHGLLGHAGRARRGAGGDERGSLRARHRHAGAQGEAGGDGALARGAHRRADRRAGRGDGRLRRGQHRLRGGGLRHPHDGRDRGDRDVRAARGDPARPGLLGQGRGGADDLARGGAFEGERILFLHTGGSVGLFGYDFAFDPGSGEG